MSEAAVRAEGLHFLHSLLQCMGQTLLLSGLAQFIATHHSGSSAVELIQQYRNRLKIPTIIPDILCHVLRYSI